MWRYFLPTRVFSGSGVLKENAGLLRETGTKAFIVTGRNSARISGALDDLYEILKVIEIPHFLFDEVEENPSFDNVEAGKRALLESECDFVIAIGGGSPLDAAKAMAVLAKNPELSCKELYGGSNLMALPVIAVPTTSGTGSEVTPYSILTDSNGIKKGFGMPSIFPVLALLDPVYTLSMPWSITLATALDALSHSLEGEIVNSAQNPLVKMLSKSATEIIARTLPLVREKQDDLILRERLQYSSMIAGMVIAHTGTTAVHAAGYPLSSFKGVKHGMANAMIIPSVFERIALSSPDTVLNAIKPFDNLEELRSFLDRFDIWKDKLDISDDEVLEWSTQSERAAHNKKTPGVFDRDFYINLYRELRGN